MDEMEEIRTPATEDTALEAAVLRQLLALHPIQATLAELVREIAGERAGFAQSDAIDRALRELAAAGLAHRNGDVVAASRAALRMDELFDQPATA